jgi:O-antigen ligase
VVELGVVGVLALAAFLLVPALVALAARRASATPELRLLCAALAGAGFGAAVCAFTFDSFSFPMVVNVYALVIGVTGACWRMAVAERERATGLLQTPSSASTRIQFRPPPPSRPRGAES